MSGKSIPRRFSLLLPRILCAFMLFIPVLNPVSRPGRAAPTVAPATTSASAAPAAIPPASSLAWTVQKPYAPHQFGSMTEHFLRIDTQDRPHLAYGEDHLYYAYHDGQSWQIEVVDWSNRIGSQASLALDSQDDPYIVYSDFFGLTYKIAHKTGGSWSIETLDLGVDKPNYISMALTSDDRLCLSYNEKAQGALKFACQIGDTWEIQVVDQYNFQQAGAGDPAAAGPETPPPPLPREFVPSLALDGGDSPHISYQDRYNSVIRYAVAVTDTWMTETITNTGYYRLEKPSLALDSAGSPHISFGHADSLLYAQRQDQNWDIQIVDQVEKYEMGEVSLTLDQEDNPHISYLADGNTWGFPTTVRYAGRLPGKWRIQKVEPLTFIGSSTSIAIDGEGIPHIGYVDSSPQIDHRLRYVPWQGNQEEITTVDIGAIVGDGPSLGLDGADRAHIAYLLYMYSMPLYGVNVILSTGNGWENHNLTREHAVWDPSIVLDAEGNPHISYIGDTYHKIYYAYWDGASWLVQTVVKDQVFLNSVSLALDSQNLPHLSYQENKAGFDTGNLAYASLTNGTWITQTVDMGENTGGTSSLDFDSQDRPAICYQDGANGDLKFARWTGEAWEIQVIDSQGNVGIFCDLALDRQDNPHITYTDYDNLDLKYAHWDGVQWIIQIVEDESKYVFHSSLAIDSTGSPHVAYNGEEGVIKYAVSTGGEWQVHTIPGIYNSSVSALALDSRGYPRLSFADAITGDLIYAIGSPHVMYFPILSKSGP